MNVRLFFIIILFSCANDCFGQSADSVKDAPPFIPPPGLDTGTLTRSPSQMSVSDLKSNYYEITGYEKLKKNDLDGAIADYSRSLEIVAGNRSAYYNRGLAKLYKHDYELAIADFTKAIELDTSDKQSYNNRGWCRYNLMDYQMAIADYDKAIGIDSDFDLAVSNKKAALQQLNFYKEGVANYTKDLEQNPHKTEAYVNRGFAELIEKTTPHQWQTLTRPLK